MRLVDQVKTIAEQRIYLDEANELYTLLTEKWIQVTSDMKFVSEVQFDFNSGLARGSL